jgi:TM2 domain-containing membrane protein YozV
MKTEAKSPLVAFLLSFIPGFGHLYIGRAFRFIVYAGGFFIPIAAIMLSIVFESNHIEGDFIIAMLAIAAFFAAINGLDIMITIARGKHRTFRTYTELPNGAIVDGDPLDYVEQQEKTKIMLLSIIPGLAHMYIGLLQRGITLLISFVAAFGGVLFVSIVMDTASLLVLWLALPIIWIYSMFDAMSLLSQKQRGEELVDQSLFVHVERHLASGKKSRGAAMVLSVFPGAGHLYIGLQQRGLQLMGLFLLGVFIMDQLRLTLFLFLLPMLWCYAFFDVMAQLRKIDESGMKDEPILLSITPYQRWIGAGLLIIGTYYLLDRITMKWIQFSAPQWYAQNQEIKYMLPTVAVAFILILLGIKLLFGTTNSGKSYQKKEEQ